MLQSPYPGYLEFLPQEKNNLHLLSAELSPSLRSSAAGAASGISSEAEDTPSAKTPRETSKRL